MTSAALVSLANHLWQSTLFAAAVWLVTLLLRSNAASLRHRLWLTASVKFLVPFSLLVGIGARLPLRTAPVASLRPVSVAVNAIGAPFPTITTINRAVGTLQPPERPSSRLPNALAALWFCGFSGCVGGSSGGGGFVGPCGAVFHWNLIFPFLRSAQRNGSNRACLVFSGRSCCCRRGLPND